MGVLVSIQQDIYTQKMSAFFGALSFLPATEQQIEWILDHIDRNKHLLVQSVRTRKRKTHGLTVYRVQLKPTNLFTDLLGHAMNADTRKVISLLGRLDAHRLTQQQKTKGCES
ncbi:MAG: hypothetical protein RKH07_12580 [Gammaproteobacteria bacterium]